MRTAYLVACGLFLLVSPAAAEITFERSESPEQAASPFTFKVQRTKASYDSFRVWGQVTAIEEDQLVADVLVLLTAFDGDGEFLGRATVDAETFIEGGSRVGYVQTSLDTNETLPARVEWSVIEKKPRFDGVETAKNPDATSADLPLIFTLEKIGTGYSGVTISGTVKNPGNVEHSGVQVILSAFDAQGKLLGRGRQGSFPNKIASGQVGFVDGLSIDCGPAQIARIQWKVVESEY